MKIGFALILSVALIMPSAFAELFTYPAKGQSAEQHTLDDDTCQKKAQKKTKYDPSMPLKPAGAGLNLERTIVDRQKRMQHFKKFETVYNECMQKKGYVIPTVVR